MTNPLISQLLKIYKKKIKFIVGFVIVSAVAVVLYSFIAPVQYTSEASLFPPKQPEAGSGLSSFLKSFSGGLSLGGASAGNNQGQVFAEILTSRAVAEHIINKCQLRQIPQFENIKQEKLIKHIQRSIEVIHDKSGVIYISVVVSSPYFTFDTEGKDSIAKLSQNMTISAIDALDSVIQSRVINAARSSLKYSEEEAEIYRKKLDSIELKIQNFQSKNKVLEIEEQTKSMLSQQMMLSKELLIAEGELKAATQEYSDNSALVKQLKSKVDLLRKKYSQSQSGGMFSNDSYSIPFSSIPELAKEYMALSRDKKIYEQVLLYLETQRHQDALQEGKDISQVEILDYPSLPTIQSAPNKKLMLLLGTILSLFISITYVSLRAKFSGEIVIPTDSIHKTSSIHKDSSIHKTSSIHKDSSIHKISE